MDDVFAPERRRILRTCALACAAWPLGGLRAAASGLFVFAEVQPLLAQVRRLTEAMAHLGEPFSDAELRELRAAEDLADAPKVQEAIERVLAGRCLAEVRINPESRVSIARGGAPARLVEQGWRAFIVKVRNEAGVTGRLAVESPQAKPVYRPSTSNAMAPPSVRQADIVDRWLALQTFDERPMEPQLSGLDVEYRIVLLYSRDRGTREAQLGAAVGEGTEDIGFRNRVAIVFTAAPSHDVTLRVRDERGQPVVASFLVEDTLGRVYPARSKRLAPDFFFQQQVYRADGETLRLPAGRVHVHGGSRSGVRHGAPGGHRSRERTGDSDRIQAHAVDRRGVAGLVLRRSPRARRGLQPLREPDRRRPARGHDAARPRRGAQHRRRAELGAELLSPASVLRGARQPSVHGLDAPAVRPRGLRVPFEPLRTSGPAAPAGIRTIRRHARSRTGRRGTCRF